MVDWANLSLFVGAVSGSLATIIYAMQKSKCSHIELCCMKCDRPVQAIDCNDLENQLENVVNKNDDRNISNTNNKADTSWITEEVKQPKQFLRSTPLP